jgi:hypothetical protein
MARRGDGIYLRGRTYSVRMILAIGMSLMLVLTLAPSEWASCWKSGRPEKEEVGRRL